MQRQNLSFKILLFIGLLIISATFIISYYSEISDFTDGILKGTGIGLILLALLPQRFRPGC
ncbi:hypothetical protein SAMN04515674_12019 [Pseudarcicella hirudinis]|uniref:Uncharacterized protein n=1 Tax=Pseudarcicella hirudinis TaxID=1079859 RepID=A0A1I5YMQ3_9BACT|nr:hypothetical protein SAMN04515674_12019 [Pseudarcicella hirudinis]